MELVCEYALYVCPCTVAMVRWEQRLKIIKKGGYGRKKESKQEKQGACVYCAYLVKDTGTIPLWRRRLIGQFGVLCTHLSTRSRGRRRAQGWFPFVRDSRTMYDPIRHMRACFRLL